MYKFPLPILRSKLLPIDSPASLCHTASMSRLTRKFIAVFMLLWLPLSSGSALAASLAMQLQQGECHESAEMMSMSHEDMLDHDMLDHDMMDHDMMQHDMMQHDHEAMQASDESNSGCTSCGVCHLACTAYLDTPVVAMQLSNSGSQAVSSIPETFVSHLSAPLVPPPLARV